MEQAHPLVGLTDTQVIDARTAFGENRLTPPRRESIWAQFFEKFNDPIIRILLIALLLSAGVSCYQYMSGVESASVFLEPLGILVALLLATCVGFFFELSANKKFDVLNQVNDDTAVKVMRNGNVCEVPKYDVVVGDIVLLETGEEVPADGELVEALSLQINESTLTGEPLVKKTIVAAEFSAEATYPSNHVMRGTSVVDGHGVMRVVAVGDATEYGKVYEGSQIDNKVETPLNKQLGKLGKMVTLGSYIVASTIIIARLAIYFTSNPDVVWLDAATFLLQTLMIAVTIIVVAVPEGLPMSVTLSLAMSMKRMLATHNLVRKMHACETMGATTVICTDKTGTLTQNQMQVYEPCFYALDNTQPLPENELGGVIKEGISVNSTAYLDYTTERIKTLGNPTEAALLLWLHEQGVNYLPLRQEADVIEQLTFSTERKYMATVVHSPLLGKRVLYVKGAPEIVLTHASQVISTDGLHPVEAYKGRIEERLLAYQRQAMRTLGFAYRILDDEASCFENGRLKGNDLTFIGVVAISDPVRADVPQAVKSCLDAGIDVKIVTGDTPGTAGEIGRQIGLVCDSDRSYITGVEFAAMSDETLLDRILDLKIMSRARPMDKERLVRLLQQKGQVVAVTGDGTNDAPALNAAQVGLSMGDGTSVAKEASDITILDNSFSSITRAVMWGRSLYKNIQRFIIFLMTINVAACLIVMIGSFLGAESPLTVTQMLWVNLIMDTFAALALASLPPDDGVMREKPRKSNAHIITPIMARRILGVGLFFVFFLFGLLQYFRHVDITSLTQFEVGAFFSNYFNFAPTLHGGVSPYELSLFFTIFVLLQFWNMFNAKAFDTGKSAFAGFSRAFIGFYLIALAIVVGQYLIVTFGGVMFHVVPLQAIDWAIIIAATSPVLWVGELLRMIKR